MKSGLTLTQMATELERQIETKRDYTAPNAAITMAANASIALKDTGEFIATDYAHAQIAQYTGIPKAYYDRLRANDTALLSSNVNRWLHDDAAARERRMVRTLDGSARAFLSSKFRPLDNYDLALATLPVLQKEGSGLRVESCALTEQRMYIKAVTERLSMEIKRGDVVQAGIVISNSEIGAGSVKIEPMIFRLVCDNGMIAADSSLRKYHVGRGHGGTEAGDVSEFFRDETRAADDRAFFMKVRDVLNAAFKREIFEALVQKMQQATAQPIEGDPVKVVEVTSKRFGLSDTERGGVLRNLIEGRELSRYGLLNAITATAKGDALEYERATELERFGGQVLELSRDQWKEIAAAA